MINQRGQAFSVFELMIAGVVAFAILLILLSIIDFPVNPNNDALSTIASAVSSVGVSGEKTTDKFVLTKDTTIGTEDLAKKADLDKSSFIFTMGEFIESDKIETDGTYLRYSGANPTKQIMATIICKQTQDDLKVALSRVDSKFDVSLASEGCPNDGIVCCVIIPKKAVN